MPRLTQDQFLESWLPLSKYELSHKKSYPRDTFVFENTAIVLGF